MRREASREAPAAPRAATALSQVYAYLVAIGRKAVDDAAAADADGLQPPPVADEVGALPAEREGQHAPR